MPDKMLTPEQVKVIVETMWDKSRYLGKENQIAALGHSHEALRAKLAEALDSAATAEQDQEILHRELDAALAREQALREALANLVRADEAIHLIGVPKDDVQLQQECVISAQFVLAAAPTNTAGDLVKVLRGALESAPMPGVSPLTGPEILAGDLHVACRSIISAYADWWEQKRGPVLAATPAEGVKNA